MTGFTPTREQRAIIEYPPVPLRVVAGAGTGKTTTIVERIARVSVDVRGHFHGQANLFEFGLCPLHEESPKTLLFDPLHRQ